MTGYRNGYINFDSPRNVFYSGQVVSGNVAFELEQPLTLSVLYIKFLGEAVVNWAETESEEYNGVKRYKNIEYVGREEYFNVTQLLAGGNAPVSLPPGTHTYKFSYQIPPGVPSSFYGDRGSITYSAKATLELRGQTEIKDEIPKQFEVVAPFDLNLGSPRLKEPINIEFEEVYNCGCFCSSDPVTIRVRLPVSGYCPGQVIPIALEVQNNSSVEVSKMLFQILKRVKFRTQRPVSEYVPPEEVLANLKQGPVMSGTTRTLAVHLRVPELIVPNLENCGIIDIGFFFKVIIKLSGCNDDLVDEAEICLGLVPLNETVEGKYVHPLEQNLPVGPIPDIPPTNQEESRQFESHQQSAYPGAPHFPSTGYPTGPQSQYPQSGYPGGPPFPQSGYPAGPPPFPQSGYPNDTEQNVQSSYSVQVRQQYYSSSDPSKNFNIGFTMTSPQGSQGTELQPMLHQNWGAQPYPNKDLRIHLPQPSVNVNTPSAPPPSS